MKIRVASYNVAARGANAAEIGAVIQRHQFDYIGLQEVDRCTSRNPLEMLQIIAQSCGYDEFFCKNLDIGGGEYGVGMAAKNEISARSTGLLDSGEFEQRGWQRGEITVGNTRIAVYNTHLSYESQAIRAAQMEKLLDMMDADVVEYKVLTGDFNADVSNEEFDCFVRRGYQLANGQNGVWIDTCNPYPSMKTLAIDNIITTKNIQIQEVRAVEEPTVESDHKLLLAVLEIPDETN